MLNKFLSWKKNRRSLPEKWEGVKIVDLPLLAVDLELNTLDAVSADLVSLGWVAARDRRIDLSSARQVLNSGDIALNQSPTIHGITAEDRSAGEELSPHLIELAAKAESHVWVLHNADLDISVLQRHWSKLGLNPLIYCIDTMLLQLYELRKHYEVIPSGLATLSAACESYALPGFNAHSAVDDAHATLLLLYAQIHHLDYEQALCLNDIRHTSAVRVF